MVAWEILEVAVLNHLSIESAIGSIADILEEDAHELVADGFLLVSDGEGGDNALLG